MIKDFTLKAIEKLYEAYLQAGFRPVTMEYYMDQKPAGKMVILRHDVDLRPANSLRVAQLQHRMGIKGTYYFRIVPESFHPDVIGQIVLLGHEIGYHYEDLSLCGGDAEKSIVHFENAMERIRKYYPVKTICMHGSPVSRFDNRDLWKKYDYKKFGITGEPYFDIDFSKGLYITDTGRSWDGDAYSIRDRVNSGYRLTFKTTFDIIRALEEQKMPDFVMQNFHPQRWTDHPGEWCRELVMQRIKNVAKAGLRKIRK